jgi:hypothetical protein
MLIKLTGHIIMDPQYQMDILNFEEKIALARLEVKKAEERVTEIGRCGCAIK